MFLVVKILLLVAFLNSAVASMKRVLLSTLFLLITKIHVAIECTKEQVLRKSNNGFYKVIIYKNIDE